MPGLRRLDPQPGLGLFDRALDADGAGFEIDILPAECQRFTASGTSPKEQ
jgi:hypothetical protein